MRRMLSDAQLRRQVLFVLGNLAACAAIVGVIVMPICSFFADRDDRIEERREVLARLTAVASQVANVQSFVSETKEQMLGGEFLVGPNENVINADLQTKLRAMAESAGARSRTVQSLPIKINDQVRYSGSRIEIFGSLQSIVRAVHTIESAKPYLFITGATLKALSATRPGIDEPVIQAQLDIFGALQVGGQP